MSLFSFSVILALWFPRTIKYTIWQALFFFLLTLTRSGRLAKIRWSICISKSQWILWFSFFRMDSGLCIYYLALWSKFNFLHSFQGITFPTQLCLVLYSFCTSLLHSLTWLTILSLSPHKLHLLFCCILSIFTLRLLVLMALYHY